LRQRIAKAAMQWCTAVGVVAVSLVAPRVTAAATIEYTATNLVDVTAGEDLWSYEYFVSDVTFLDNQGFSIYFDPALYAALQDPPPGVADWLLLTIQPDPGLPDAGFYEGVAITPSPSLVGPFTLSFVWLGQGTPGVQPFTIDAFDDEGFYSKISDGVTTPRRSSVPEPSTLSLLAAGAVALWRRARSGRPTDT